MKIIDIMSRHRETHLHISVKHHRVDLLCCERWHGYRQSAHKRFLLTNRTTSLVQMQTTKSSTRQGKHANETQWTASEVSHHASSTYSLTFNKEVIRHSVVHVALAVSANEPAPYGLVETSSTVDWQRVSRHCALWWRNPADNLRNVQRCINWAFEL